jgi:hypothetical protein
MATGRGWRTVVVLVIWLAFAVRTASAQEVASGKPEVPWAEALREPAPAEDAARLMARVKAEAPLPAGAEPNYEDLSRLAEGDPALRKWLSGLLASPGDDAMLRALALKALFAMKSDQAIRDFVADLGTPWRPVELYRRSWETVRTNDLCGLLLARLLLTGLPVEEIPALAWKSIPGWESRAGRLATGLVEEESPWSPEQRARLRERALELAECDGGRLLRDPDWNRGRMPELKALYDFNAWKDRESLPGKSLRVLPDLASVLQPFGQVRSPEQKNAFGGEYGVTPPGEPAVETKASVQVAGSAAEAKEWLLYGLGAFTITEPIARAAAPESQYDVGDICFPVDRGDEGFLLLSARNNVILRVDAPPSAARETALAIAQAIDSELVRLLKEGEQRDVLGFRLSAELARHEFAAGEPVLIRLTTTNVSEKTMRLMASGAMWTFEADDQYGYEVSLTRQGLYQEGRLPGHPSHEGVRGGRLEPRQSWDETMQLDRLVDLTMNGTYTMRVGRCVTDDEGNWATVWTPWFDLKISGSFHEPVEAQKVLLEPTWEGVRSLGTQAREIIGALQQLTAKGDGTVKWTAGNELKQIQEQLQPAAADKAAAE